MLPYLDQIEMLLVMTVEPGFGGQAFMADQLPKIAQLHDVIRQSGRQVHLEVDGGIGSANSHLVRDAGVDVIVAGSAVFKAADRTAEIKGIKGL